MSRLVYACQFDLPADKGLKWPRSAYQEWLARRYGLPFDQLTNNLPRGHTIELNRFETSDGEVETIDWSFPSDDDDKMLWRNSVRMCRVPNSVALEHTISVESLEFRVAPVRILLGSPKVIRWLCANSTIRIGDLQVTATPYRVAEEDTETLCALLESPKRRLPIVFLATSSNGSPNLLDPNLLAQNLAGIAIVAESTSGGAAWALTERVGRPLSCFAGGARIYWPGFTKEADPKSHPLFLGSTITCAGNKEIARAIERSIFAVACYRFAPDPRMNHIVREAERAARRLVLDERSEQNDWEAYAIELDGQLAGANAKVRDLEAEVINLRENQEILLTYQGESGGELSSTIAEPQSVEDAVIIASDECESLLVLDSALKAASKSPFSRPSEILDALRAINAAAAELFLKGGEMRDLLVQKGAGRRCGMHISATSKNRFKGDYTFFYDGEEILFEPHVTIGSGDAASCASVHFILDHSNKRAVIGHVGKHLRNTKTN